MADILAAIVAGVTGGVTYAGIHTAVSMYRRLNAKPMTLHLKAQTPIDTHIYREDIMRINVRKSVPSRIGPWYNIDATRTTMLRDAKTHDAKLNTGESTKLSGQLYYTTRD